MITYGSLVWWPAVRKVTCRSRLSQVQRLACLCMSGAFRTTPSLSLEALLGLIPLHITVEAEARSASARLNNWGQWEGKQGDIGHCRIWLETIRNDGILLNRDDIPKVQVQSPKYKTIIPDRNDWNQPDPPFLRPRGLIWFTDESLMPNETESGVYGCSPKASIALPLGKYATVYQAEIYAILACALENLARGYQGLHIYICTDSQAALKALTSRRVTSRITLECRESLDRLGTRNRVKLVWVPGHQGIGDNEEADALAREGSATPFIGPEPALPCSTSLVKSRINSWATAQFKDTWTEQTGHRQSKIFLNVPLKDTEVKRLLELDRRELRATIGVITGNWVVNYHLQKIGLSTDSDCRFCHEADETAEHIVCECDALVNFRLRYLGDRWTEPRELRDIGLERVAPFLKRIGLLESHIS